MEQEFQDGLIISSGQNIDITEIWQKALNVISSSKNISSVVFDVWIETLEPVEIKGNTFVLATPSISSKKRLMLNMLLVQQKNNSKKKNHKKKRVSQKNLFALLSTQNILLILLLLEVQTNLLRRRQKLLQTIPLENTILSLFMVELGLGKPTFFTRLEITSMKPDLNLTLFMSHVTSL